MAHIPRRNPDGSPVLHSDGTFTVVYRPAPSEAQVSWRCDSLNRFEDFCRFERAARKAGLRVQKPEDLFPEYPGVPTPQLPEASAPANGYTVREWLGTRTAPGPLWRHKRVAPSTARNYFGSANMCGQEWLDMRLPAVTWETGESILNRLIACKACTARAIAAGRTDLLADPEQLAAHKPPWDDECVDADGISTHKGARRRGTVRNTITNMKLLFDAAITCGTGPVVREERCRGILVNPFQGLEIPNYPQHATRHDTKQALTHPQLEALEVEMPGWARVAPILGAYGMLRPGELLGAERSMILWPTRADDLGGGIVIKKTWHVDGQLLEYGKNDHATDNPIRLPDFVMEALRRHVDEWVSKPMPDRCLACADGVGENWDPTYANPHTRCGFADDAPLFTMPSTGRRPSRCHFAAIFASAADAAGLRIGGFLPSPHILRLSGAIAYLQIGRAPNEVCRMGRWESDATLLRFYNKPNAKAFADAARAVDAAARAGRGMEGGNPITDAERIAVLEARIEYLESRNAAFIDAFGDLPEPDRGRAGFPKSSFTDEEFLEAVAGATAEHEVALRLGRPNIRSSSLRLRAELLGVKLPPKRID